MSELRFELYELPILVVGAIVLAGLGIWAVLYRLDQLLTGQTA